MSGLDTTLLVGLLFAYLLVRQAIKRPVTRLDFILPILGAVYLTARYLDGPGTASQIFVEISATVGILSGLIAAGMVRVWRDAKTGIVYQFGGWRYAAVLFVLLATREVWRLFVDTAGIAASVTLLNDALIALALGNYLGRTLHVGIRALHLTGWNPRAIPGRRDVRKLKSPPPK